MIGERMTAKVVRNRVLPKFADRLETLGLTGPNERWGQEERSAEPKSDPVLRK